MMENLDLLAPVWTHVTTMQPVRGEGVYLYDENDERYIDFTSGIGVTNTGHCHPKVVRAIQEQAEKLLFGQVNIVIPHTTTALAEALNRITPSPIDTFFFSNSGAEAVEGAIKLARHATGKPNIIVFQGGFHGRTSGAMALTTAKTVYRVGYQPLPAGVFVAPYPYSYYYGWDEEATTEFCMKQLDLILHTQTAPDETAAVLIEPVLGEGGYVPAPIEFLKQLREFCTQHNILLIMDEVQSGFGRTGKMFGFEHAAIVPDIMVMAKGLGSGLPISGIASSRELMERWRPGTHGGTYGGGSAIAGAAALATVQVISEERLDENAAVMGERLQQGLEEMQGRYSVIGDVRGRGLMVATEFTGADGKPDAHTAKAVHKACIDRKLLLLTCGPYGNTIRWIPPLIVTAEQIDEALQIFADAIQEVVA